MGSNIEQRGRLFVVSGPSGSGKSTLVRRAVERPETRSFLSISATTRPIRPGEEQGRDYVFVSREHFEAERDQGRFLEWAEVHGNLYGTPRGPVEAHLDRGENVLLEIDVQGAMQVREQCPVALLVFVTTPSFELLESRLRLRATDDEATIQRRLANARRELELLPEYNHVLINDDLDQAVEELISILTKQPPGGLERDA